MNLIYKVFLDALFLLISISRCKLPPGKQNNWKLSFLPKSVRARIKILVLHSKSRFLAKTPSFLLNTDSRNSCIYWNVYLFLLNSLVFCFFRIKKGIYFFRKYGLVERALDLKQHLNFNLFNGSVTLGK